jgi:hypothetical protein
MHAMLGLSAASLIFVYSNFCRSISVSPKGWTDMELGYSWLVKDFHPSTVAKAAGG